MDEKTIEERLYPTQAPVAQDAPQAPTETPGEPEPQGMTVEELVASGDPVANALFGGGGQVPEAPSGYDAPLASAFDGIEREARIEGNEEEAAAYVAGRRASAAALHDLRVPQHEAVQLSNVFRDWHLRDEADEDSKHRAADTAFEQLEKEWGKETGARIELARRVAADAIKRMPWLGALLDKGAGNDVRLIRMLADIGLRKARRSKQ